MTAHCTLTCLLLLAPAADDKKPTAYPRPELLLEAAELAKPEVAKKFLVLDARPKAQYQAGHVPGAFWVDTAQWSKAFNAPREDGTILKLINVVGVVPGRRVVVYDDGDAKEAARVWFIARYHGIDDVRLLNGGWKAWTDLKGPTSKEEPAGALELVAYQADEKRLATKDGLLRALKDKSVLQILDARSKEEFCGETRSAKRNGAIPGAVHLEWSDTLDPKSKRFKSAEELTRLFKDAGIDLNKPAVTYCQSGGRASVLAFALELMGAKDVRNYYKSWAEWGNDPDTPIDKPKK